MSQAHTLYFYATILQKVRRPTACPGCGLSGYGRGEKAPETVNCPSSEQCPKICTQHSSAPTGRFAPAGSRPERGAVQVSCPAASPDCPSCVSKDPAGSPRELWFVAQAFLSLFQLWYKAQSSGRVKYSHTPHRTTPGW